MDAEDECEDARDACDAAAEATHNPSINSDEQCSEAFCAEYDTCNAARDTCYDSIDPTCDESCADEHDALDNCENPEFDFEYEFEDPTDEPTAGACYCGSADPDDTPPDEPPVFATDAQTHTLSFTLGKFVRLVSLCVFLLQ